MSARWVGSTRFSSSESTLVAARGDSADVADGADSDEADDAADELSSAANTVAGAPNFPALWEKIEPLMSSGILCAHNAVFDLGVLKKCLNDYGIEWKSTVKYCCTVQTGRKALPGISHKLNVLCEHYGIALDHHKADSDSRACAEILLRYFESGVQERDIIRSYRLR